MKPAVRLIGLHLRYISGHHHHNLVHLQYVCMYVYVSYNIIMSSSTTEEINAHRNIVIILHSIVNPRK